MIAFSTVFLALTVGAHPVQVSVSQGVAAVELRLDGEPVGVMIGEPWALDCDFGPDLEPHELVAVALDEEGHELARVSQEVNQFPSRAEVGIVLEPSGSNPRRARLVWEAVSAPFPQSIEVRFDGDLLHVVDPDEIRLPIYDAEETHFLTANLDFSETDRARGEVVFGGSYGDRVATDLTSVAVVVEKGYRLPRLEELQDWFVKQGNPLRVAAVDRESPHLFVVPDYRADSSSVTTRTLRQAKLFPLVTRGGQVFLVEPAVRRQDGSRYAEFPVRPGLEADNVPELLSYMRHRGFTLRNDELLDTRFADAVAVAGQKAAATGKPRAVLLILGATAKDTNSQFGAAQVRAYLEKLRVPLHVWSPQATTPAARRALEEWGEIRDVTSPSKLKAAVQHLQRDLGAQVVVWLDGNHLSHEVSLSRYASEKVRLVGGAFSLETRDQRHDVVADNGPSESSLPQLPQSTEPPRPDLLEAAGDLVRQGVTAWQQGDSTRAEDHFRRALEIYQEHVPGSLDMAHCLTNLAATCFDRGELARAQSYYHRALGLYRRQASGRRHVADVLYSLGSIAHERGDLALAAEHFAEALEIHQHLDPGASEVAEVLFVLGTVAWQRGEVARSKEHYRQAMDLYRSREPDSPEAAHLANLLATLDQETRHESFTCNLDQVNHWIDQGFAAREQSKKARTRAGQKKWLTRAKEFAAGALREASSLTNLGLMAKDRGDSDGAESCYRQALAAYEELAPDSLLEAACQVQLGSLLRERGELTTAEEHLQRARKLYETLSPDSLAMAQSLTGLGHVAWERGDPKLAEDYHARALALQRELYPESLPAAGSLLDLGSVATDLGDLDRAEEYFEQALEFSRNLHPESLEVAESLSRLGVIAWQRGELERAEDYLERASELYLRSAPESEETAANQLRQGVVARARGDLDSAEESLRQAWAFFHDSNPEGLPTAAALVHLGRVAMDRGELDRAESLHARALAIRSQAAPESLLVAGSLVDLGALALKRGDPELAERYFTRALTLRSRQAPQSLPVADSLVNLAAAAQARGDLDRAEGHLHQAYDLYRKLSPNSLELAGCTNSLGLVARDRGRPDQAERHLDRALELYGRLAPESLFVADNLRGLGLVALDRGEPELAETYLRRALAIERRLAPESLGIAGTLSYLGHAARHREKPELAEAFYAEAQDLRRDLPPEDPRVASGWSDLGLVALDLGELEAAEKHFHRAWAAERTSSPGSLAEAKVRTHLGRVAQVRGDGEVAEQHLGEALDIYRKLSPESPEEAEALTLLGLVARHRGDLDLAVDHLERALRIQEELAPESLGVAATLTQLGPTVARWGAPELAEQYLHRALALYEKLAPDSLKVADCWINLGSVARERGESDLAESLYVRALDLQQKRAPESRQTATTLTALGLLASDRDDPELAEQYLERALELEQRRAPGSLRTATVLTHLGLVTLDRGEDEVAEVYFERALAIRQVLAPGTEEVAATAHALGIFSRRSRQPERAADFFRQSIEALESQIAKLGGTQDFRAGFRARREVLYEDYLELLLEMGRPEDAFLVLEQSRARSFLEMLAERDLAFSDDVPKELEEVRRNLAVRYDRIQHRIVFLDSERDRQEIDALLAELRKLYQERDGIAEKIRRASPALAALRYPRPLDLDGVRKALDAGTVMLSYSVGKVRTDLFVVTATEGLKVEALPVGERDLRREIEAFREKIHWRRPGAEVVGKRLYEMLIEPVAEMIDRHERMLIIPDGPLHTLPWSALVRETGGPETAPPERGRQYLAEWKPVHSVLSATVYAELKRSERPARETADPSAPLSLAAFGNPRFPHLDADEIAEARVRSAAQRGFDLRTLPATQSEVEQIAELYPGSAEVYVGQEATEEHAKALDRNTRYVHFATHGLLDQDLPLNSALVLTVPEQFREGHDNGLLQAWEIFERVRLDADLVVLSACQSALGGELGGEGLIGLTRAFQYAGARTVAASLWQVADRATAELMVRFYRHLKEGKPKDEALRAAQVELIRNPIRLRDENGRVVEKDVSAPYYWSAFQIYGDWQ